jgi:light-regulated signal transduction histidine kinase (bacteriophytochrome)
MVAQGVERRRAEDERALRAEELARSNAELEQFAYVASHDLQEPLRVVVSYLQLLERRYKGQLDERADKYIGYAVGASERMKQLINDLLTYSRVGRKERAFADVDLERLLTEVRADLGVAIEESGAVISHGRLPTVRGEPRQLHQLLLNLVGNAIKFRRDDPPRVHVSAERDEHGWRFDVRDNGIGIDPSFNERIFVIFQRLHGRTEYPGTGIGLALAKKIVERHGGRIWVEPAPDHGSIFSFTLPDGSNE